MLWTIIAAIVWFILVLAVLVTSFIAFKQWKIYGNDKVTMNWTGLCLTCWILFACFAVVHP